MAQVIWRVGLLALTVVVAISCAGAQATPEAAPTASPAQSPPVNSTLPAAVTPSDSLATPSAPPSSTPQAIPTAEPTPSATPKRTPVPPTPISGVVAPWVETTRVGLGYVSNLWAAAVRDGTYVLSGQPMADGWDAHLWFSDDAVAWQLATMPAQPHIDRIHAITSTADGFVALGLDFSGEETLTQVLVSRDAHSWQIAGSYVGVGTDVAEIDGRLLAINNGNSVSDPQFSDDGGTTWKVVDTQSGLAVASGLLALYGADGYLWAVRSDDPSEDASITTPVELWRTTNGLDWTKVTDMPDSIAANSAAMTSGPNGWVISARRATFTDYEQSNEWFAWHSADGLNWQSAKSVPQYVDQIVADTDGFIGIGRDRGSCCVLEASNVRQLIWTSAEGSVWQQQPQKGWHGREIDFVASVGDRVLGVGIDWPLSRDSLNAGWGVGWQVDRADLLP